MADIALTCDVQLLIVDEPAVALDVTIQVQIPETIRQLRREHHT